ncbi:unnamed protein product [Clonostachys chloroleuca]|uniref:Uncharacterized protein n=1 Tax=Clonostachys chloroleuca TaxID=1926264 RepID=A0AA35M8Z5_9HYPO|nr:unnamed protein product [Clonostachys chloroleuca]
MSGHEVIHLKYDGKLAVITLDNASKFNSLTQASYRRLATLLREADANEDVVVTLLIGEGPFFSAPPAALISHSDFIYSVPDAYVLTPFSSLELVAEGGASVAFVQRMGWGKANEALILGRKIPVQELVQVGFVNKLFQDKAKFRQQVLEHVQATFGDHVVGSSMLGTKALLRRRLVHEQDEAAPLETFGGLDRFCEGIPQTEMAKVASGSKKHRL